MKHSIMKRYVVAICVLFFLLVFVMIYVFLSFYNGSVSNMNELGASNMKNEVALIENYLAKSSDVLWVTADNVNYMMEHSSSNEEILQYLTEETKNATEEIDKNFTGIYGFINGEYLDGIGWEPPADYVATERIWYQVAKEANGKIAIVPPYLDVQTGKIMFSVCQLLSDGESVISLDIALDEVQEIVQNLNLNGIGYGFIMDQSGLVIAHFDEKERGKIYPDIDSRKEMIDQIKKNDRTHFETMVGNEHCIVFSSRIMDDWYAVIVVNNSKRLYQIRKKIVFCVLAVISAFLLVVVFCVCSARKIQIFQKKECESRERLDRLNTNIIRALAFTIDAKDSYTSGHSQRVADYSLAIAKRMGKSEEEQKIIYCAGLLHDVGKIRVPEEIINKPGKLSEEEFRQIQIHSVSGFHILKDVHEDARIAYGAKFHHERYNGKGYPNGLEGENIPEIARIIGVADAYDAMASNRSYRSALPQAVVRAEIEKGRGQQFDPQIADIMLQMIDEDNNYSMSQSGSVEKKVLVVDDEMINIKMVKRILKDIPDFEVIGAMTKEEAFEVLENNKIHLILLDLIMPDIDGFELYECIRQTYCIPVVMVTADKSLATIHKITELGIDDYLTKPLQPFVVRETVHSIINGWNNRL